MLTWEGNKLGEKRYTHKPVSPVVESEAPCCGDGLSGICLLIIHFIFKILTTPESNIFHFFPKILNSSPPPLIVIHSKNHPQILKKKLLN